MKRRYNMVKKKYKMLNYHDRLKIEIMFNKKFSVKEIASEIGSSKSNIYKELKIGKYFRIVNDKKVKGYSADIAEQKHTFNKSNRGPGLKIDKDIEFANFIEFEICENKLSPEAILLKLKNNPDEYNFKTVISSPNTIYSYIDKGVFLRAERKHLPTIRKKKAKKKAVVIHRKVPEGYSIENRNENLNVLDRNEFGHFEGDTVVSGDGDNSAILVLTERKTRFPIFIKISRNTSYEVARAFDRIERAFGAATYKIIKSVTFDNGSEFSGYEAIEKAKRRKGKRFDMYYAHPYSPYERGSNENNNRFIRRWYPKGTKFKNVLQKQIFELQKWVSEYPRRMFNGKSSKDLFIEELKNLGIDYTRLAI